MNKLCLVHSFVYIFLSSLTATAQTQVYVGHSNTGFSHSCSYVEMKEQEPVVGDTWKQAVGDAEHEAEVNAKKSCWADYQNCEVLDLSLFENDDGCFGQAIVRGTK